MLLIIIKLKISIVLAFVGGGGGVGGTKVHKNYVHAMYNAKFAKKTRKKNIDFSPKHATHPVLRPSVRHDVAGATGR